MIDNCSLCKKEWEPDDNEFGFVWLCPDCQTLPGDCVCGSDDISFDWDVTDDDDNILSNPAWRILCMMCERTTAQFATPQEALSAWQAGKVQPAEPEKAETK